MNEQSLNQEGTTLAIPLKIGLEHINLKDII